MPGWNIENFNTASSRTISMDFERLRDRLRGFESNIPDLETPWEDYSQAYQIIIDRLSQSNRRAANIVLGEEGPWVLDRTGRNPRDTKKSEPFEGEVEFNVYEPS